jgi:hypothetical protein
MILATNARIAVGTRPRIFDRRKAGAILKQSGLASLADYIYGFDSNLYSRAKSTEGQYSYIRYMTKVREMVETTFYDILPDHRHPASAMAGQAEARQARPCSDTTVIILNNTSLLGHVSVLLSMNTALIDRFGERGLYVVCLFHQKGYREWSERLKSKGFVVFDLVSTQIADRLCEVNEVLRPHDCLWWGWPPGQWMGPLFCPSSRHRSISFKYDFPLDRRFYSHHVGYGAAYASSIVDEKPVIGFHQPVFIDSIPGFSASFVADQCQRRQGELMKQPLTRRPIIHIGTLARAEKVLQKDFLAAVIEIMLKDKRIVFHWTGRAMDKQIKQRFADAGLAGRQLFHGWVKSVDYLPKLDIYLDTFPYGTGEAFVSAGYLGIPLVAMASPYESSFTHLLNVELANEITMQGYQQYIMRVLSLCSGEAQSLTTLQQSQAFEVIFNSAEMVDLPLQI